MNEIEPGSDTGETNRHAEQSCPPTLPASKPTQNQKTNETEPHQGAPAQETATRERWWRALWRWVATDTTSTDWIIVVLTAVMAITTWLQWEEIHSGGEDTHALATAAVAQAAAAKVQATAQQQITLAAMVNVLAQLQIATAANNSAANAAKLATIATAQLERTDRPFVIVDISAGGPVTATNYGMLFALQVTLTNIGRSQATAVHGVYEFNYGGNESPDKAVLADCVAAETMLRSVTPGASLWPTKTDGVFFSQLLLNRIIRQHLIPIKDVSGEYFAPVFFGCVAYKIPYSERVHRTPFAYHIYRTPRTPSALWNVYQVGISVPAEDMWLVRDTLKQGPD